MERNPYGEGGDAVYVSGSLTWPRRLWIFSSVLSPGIYDIESRTWREVPTGITPGGLSYRGLLRSEPVVLVDLGLVEANGNLLDVRTATWLKVPEAPVPDRWDPVEAVGPDSLLSCFGYHYSDDSFESGRFAVGCQLLTVGSMAPVSSTASPANPTVAPSGGLPGKAFRGTLQEYNDARMSCVAGYGPVVVPGDPNDSPSFGVSSEGVGRNGHVGDVGSRLPRSLRGVQIAPARWAPAT